MALMMTNLRTPEDPSCVQGQTYWPMMGLNQAYLLMLSLPGL